MSSGFDYALLDRILEAHDCAPRNTIAILQDVQEHYHYLPQEAFPYMAKRLNVGEARLYSVATFLRELFPRAKGEIRHQGLRRHRLPCKKVHSDTGAASQ